LKKLIITKTRKNENTKNEKFRAFQISCFRDESLLILRFRWIRVRGFKVKNSGTQQYDIIALHRNGYFLSGSSRLILWQTKNQGMI